MAKAHTRRPDRPTGIDPDAERVARLLDDALRVVIELQGHPGRDGLV
jgi:hypothetical protein